MRILTGTDRIVFQPETEYDKSVLKKLNNSTVKQIIFDDSWTLTGNLNVIFTDSSSWEGPNGGYGSNERGGR